MSHSHDSASAGEPPALNQASEPAVEPLSPPTTWWGTLLRIGPGLILVGNIVGSGELIATPSLSANAGYTLLWLIIFSCVIKVFFQIEIGRYTVSEGKTALESFNQVPGPKWGVNWLLWFWLLMLISTLIQIGGICGGVAQALRLAIPMWSTLFQISDPQDAQYLDDTLWAVFVTLTVIAILYRGRYRPIELLAMTMVTLFTLVTVYSVWELMGTTKAPSWDEVRAGLEITFPKDDHTLFLALMAFGITGVGASELVAYPYWCLEKGYGKFVGRDHGDPNWLGRARGWLKVMQVDAWSAMILFTLVTIAFYILGAALIHPTGLDPKGAEMISVLSHMYKDSFGVYANHVFLFGAISVLYSTFFIATAANARMLADWLGLIGLYNAQPNLNQKSMVSILSVIFPVLSLGAFLTVQAPRAMVAVSGFMQAIMLPALGVAVLYFAHLKTDPRLRGGIIWYIFLWVSFVLMSVLSITYGLIVLWRGFSPS